jgi:hypothetical protein
MLDIGKGFCKEYSYPLDGLGLMVICRGAVFKPLFLVEVPSATCRGAGAPGSANSSPAAWLGYTPKSVHLLQCMRVISRNPVGHATSQSL